MFENLSERLERSFKILKGEGKITEVNVAETLKDVRKALLDADVNYKVAKTFTDTVKEKALGQNVLTAVRPSQLMVKIVHDELTALMGGDTVELELKGHPSVILMSGLQGSGKTTMSGKLALMLKNKKHRRPLLAACDVYRPAAIDQLTVLGEQIEVPIYKEEGNKNPIEIAQNAIREAKAKNYDVVIVDTAGRLAVDEQMMQEIAAIKEAVMYFSRSAVPYKREITEENTNVPYWQHCGIYGYRREALERFVSLPPSPLEQLEKLEQLRALEDGLTIKCVAIDAAGPAIDTARDLQEAEEYLKKI